VVVRRDGAVTPREDRASAARAVTLSTSATGSLERRARCPAGSTVFTA